MAVRRERVVLELEDRFSGPLGRPIAASQVLNRSLNDLDKSTVRTERNLANGGREVDRMSGRLRLLADAALLVGPALVPIGAVALPALTGLASAGGAAALGIGTMVAAFQGVGDALTAVNDAALEPTTENLEKAREAMSRLSPEARDLVRQIQEMRPAFTALRDASAAGLFPGLSTALDDLDRVLPRVEGILRAVGDAAGDVTAEFAEGLAGPRGREFLAFIEAEMPNALTELGHTAGNVAAGLAELWMAFGPLNRDVSGWLLDASRAFDDWATGLSQTQGFQDFVAYIRENGPRVADAMGAIGNAVLQIVQAAAPLGGPTLAALEAVADVVGAIADSSYGPALVALAAGLTLVSRAIKTMQALKATSLFTGLTGAASGTAGSLTRLQGAGVAAGVGLTAAFAAGTKLVDLFREDLPGVEQLSGMLSDLSTGQRSSLPAEFDSLANSIERINNPSFWKGQATSDTVLGFFGLEGRTLTNATDEVEALEGALLNLLQVQGPQASESAFRVMAEDAGLTGDQIARLRELMPGYTDALAGAQRAAVNMGDRSSAAARRAAHGFEAAAGAAKQFRDAVDRALGVLDKRASLRAARDAVRQFTETLKDAPKDLRRGTAAYDRVEAALDEIGRTSLEAAGHLRGMDKTEYLKQARRNFVDAAVKMGLARDRAQTLADKLGLVDRTKANPKIEVDTSGAQAAVQSVQSWLNSIQDEKVYVDVERRYRGVQKYASGGTVAGQRYPYGDKVLAMLAPGEEVISNRHGQADRFRADRAAGRIPHYADGGQVAAMNRAGSPAPRVSVGSPNVNVGGPQVRVFIDGKEIDARVESRFADHTVDAAERATSYGYGSVG